MNNNIVGRKQTKHGWIPSLEIVEKLELITIEVVVYVQYLREIDPWDLRSPNI